MVLAVQLCPDEVGAATHVGSKEVSIERVTEFPEFTEVNPVPAK
jgi:hypothetical protein